MFPHTFPKKDPKPHIIVDLNALQEKYDMLLVCFTLSFALSVHTFNCRHLETLKLHKVCYSKLPRRRYNCDNFG